MSKYLLTVTILIAPLTLYSSDKEKKEFSNNNFETIELKYNNGHDFFFSNSSWWTTEECWSETKATINYAKQLTIKDTGYTLKNIIPVVLVVSDNSHALVFEYKEDKKLEAFTVITPEKTKILLDLLANETPVFNITYKQETDNTIYYLTKIFKNNWTKHNCFRSKYEPSYSLLPHLIKTRVAQKYIKISGFLLFLALLTFLFYVTS